MSVSAQAIVLAQTVKTIDEIPFDQLPSAADLALAIEKNKKEAQELHEKRRLQQLEKLRIASNEYTGRLMTECLSAIHKMNADKTRTSIRINLQEIGRMIKQDKINDVPVDVLHYGHRNGRYSWTERTPLDGVENAFQLVQKKLADKGYYLVDESDPEVSKLIVISIYCQRPAPTHRYFNKPGTLWHGYNVIPDLE